MERAQRITRTDRGWILPAVLALTAVLSAATGSLVLSAIRSAGIARLITADAIARGELSRRIANRSIFESGCERSAVEIRGGEWVRLVCIAKSSPFRSYPESIAPLEGVDWSSLGALVTDCPGTLSLNETVDFLAPEAGTDCHLPDGVTSSLIVKDNVVAATISIQGRGSTAQIVAPGTLRIGSLLIDSDTLLIAGGAIEIGTVTTESPAARITLISAWGDLLVQRKSANVSIQGYGRKRIEIPWSKFEPHSLPLTRSQIIRGIELPER